MGIEIERKFLIINDTWQNSIQSSEFFRQGYLKNEGKCSVRIRINGKQAQLNIKSACRTDSGSINRSEYEYEVPLQDATEMLDNLCTGSVIEKTRHLVEHGSHIWEVDVFEGDNAGLIVAEIELKNANESYQQPEWLGKEVTGDAKYFNAMLMKNPFKNW